MSLSMITSALHIAGRNSQSIQAMIADHERRAENVARFRRYRDGDHDNNISAVMRAQLSIKSTSESSHRFNNNKCSIILDTEQDRINLTGVKADNDPASEWIKDFLERTRIDSLQIDVHQSALCDGDTYLMVYVDPETSEASFSSEPAYDGSSGIDVWYESAASKTPMFAVKVWQITSLEVADTTRVNVYYPDRIERYTGQSSTGLIHFTEDDDSSVIGWITPEGRRLDYPVIPWVMPDGKPIGVPIIHFRNRSASASNFGLSEIENAIPLQDAENMAMSSTIATGILSGFPIRLAVGVAVPAAVVPGLVLNASVTPVNGVMPQLTAEQLNYLNSIRLDQFEVADLAPQISLLNWLNEQMYSVTNTPTDDIAADASGEARKQSEVKLIGKVKRFEVRNGNAWEDAIRLAAKVETVYTGNTPPAFKTLTAQWDSPEIRDDKAFAAMMLADYQAGVIDQRTYLESVAEMRGWSPEQIDKIIAETEKAKNAAVNQINPADAQGAQDLLNQIGAGGQQQNAQPVNANGNGVVANGS